MQDTNTNNQTDNSTNPAAKTVTPDSETVERIKNLAYVGKAIYSSGSETSYETDFFLAKDALSKFKAGIERLQLDPDSQKGMMDLIGYLDKKIDKRIKAVTQGTALT